MIDLSRAKLAINGGVPTRVKPWKDNFTVGAEEKEAVCRVIDSGYLSLFEGSYTPDPPFSFEGGPEVKALEHEWADFYECSHAVSVNSATSGLYAAIGALDIGYGDEVIVSPYTMTACALAPLIYGAIPVFADVEAETGSLDPQSIRSKVTERTKAILLVHQFGIPADMSEIINIAAEDNLRVIEDCAQAHAAEYKGRPVGTMGDIGVFSLNVNKSIQSGEGGVCITNNEALAYRLALIRNHGEAVIGPAGCGDMTNIAGYNYRLTELQAAVAREQLKKLPRLNAHRLELVSHLQDHLAKIPGLEPLTGREGCKSTYYVFPMLYDEEAMGVTRHDFISAVNAEGISFSEGYVPPLYRQPVYQRRQLFKCGYPFSAPENKESTATYSGRVCPMAEELHERRMILNEHIRFPHTLSDMKDIITAITKVVQ